MNFEKKNWIKYNTFLVHKVVFHVLPCVSLKKKRDYVYEIGDKLRCVCVAILRGTEEFWNNGRNRKLE